MLINELRLGNWLQRLDGSFFQVTPTDFTLIPDRSEYLQPKPIPLTEEILLKAAFVLRNKNANAYQHKLTTRYGYLKNGVFTFAGMYGEYRFVHELQNIFFAVYKEELTIDLC